MAVTLHGYSYSVYLRIARMTMLEKGVAWSHVEIDPFADEIPADYLALNPFGRVPTLDRRDCRREAEARFTADRMVADHLRLYRYIIHQRHLDPTGDLYLVDRLKELVIVSGFNVYPSEVEDVIAEVDGVAEAAVIGTEHAETGEAVVAYVKADPDRALSEQELVEAVRDHCAARLARFKQPTAINVVPELPHTITGKVAKGRLRALARSDDLADATGKGRYPLRAGGSGWSCPEPGPLSPAPPAPPQHPSGWPGAWSSRRPAKSAAMATACTERTA